MPIYEFQCVECGDRKEALIVKKSDWKEIKPCEKCGGKMKQMISAPNHQIHGFSEANGYSHKKDVKKNDNTKPKQ